MGGDDDRPLWIKPESLQVIGAFNAIGRFDESVRTRGVVAYSSGNHAQAVAHAAAVFGIPAHIVMPRETPEVKVAATRGHGAEVVLCEAGQRERVAAELVEETGGLLIPPFDHPDIIAGQGTVGLKIAEDLPTVENVLVPVSGGGLASGIGTAIKALRPNARVIGVEPELASDTAQGLRVGHRVEWSIEDRNRTIADGLRSQPSELTFAHLQAGAGRCRHGSRKRNPRSRTRTRSPRESGQRAQRRGGLGRLPSGLDTCGTHGDGLVRPQHRTRAAAGDPGLTTRGVQVCHETILATRSISG